MNEKSVVVNVFGLNFNVTNCLGGTLVAIAVFFLVWYLGRNVSLKPNKKQNLLEYMIDFTNGIVKDNVADVAPIFICLYPIHVHFLYEPVRFVL